LAVSPSSWSLSPKGDLASTSSSWFRSEGGASLSSGYGSAPFARSAAYVCPSSSREMPASSPSSGARSDSPSDSALGGSRMARRGGSCLGLPEWVTGDRRQETVGGSQA